ncbi:hypothetical protein BDW62DRAFT_200313 [Aspergillus aurantiobrunneus]
MSSNGQESSQMTNGTDSNLSEGNVNNVPDESSRGADRISQSSSADEPYFAHSRMEDRSEHMSHLTSQLDASDEVLKK